MTQFARQLASSESTLSWKGMIEDLVARGLRSPEIVIVDGNAGLLRAIRDHWSTSDIQRCTKHKWENIKAAAPKHCHAERKRDYAAITHAENRAAAEKAYATFCRKWQPLVPEVVVSLEEAGHELLTFYNFPAAMWKSLRTTNLIERINEEFRRRTKTQGSFPTEAAALTLLFGLIASGAIRLRKIDGYHQLEEMMMGAQRRIA